MTAVERDRLDAALTALASQESTEAIDIQIGINTDPPQTQLGLIDHAARDRPQRHGRRLVRRASGRGRRAGRERVDFPLVGEVTRQVIDRDGAPTSGNVLYAIDAVDRITVASHPLIVDGEMVGVLTLQSDPIEIPAFAEFAAGIAFANGVILVAIGLPALIVSIPVGIWRASRLSKRLSDLADTATAMGDGDLSRRVAVRGHDEVARVSERFNDMVDRLQTTDQARKSFVANVSHELADAGRDHSGQPRTVDR